MLDINEERCDVVSNHNVQATLDQISRLLQSVQQQIMETQGKEETLESSIKQLEEIEQQLATVKADGEIETNPQFQQAFEQLHDLRRNVNHLRQ